MGKQCQILFWGAPKSLQMVTAARKLKDAYSLEEKLWPTEIAYSKTGHYFAKKCPSGQGCGFSSSHVWMWELDCEESWAPKNRCFWTVVLEKTLESPWTARRSNQSILKEISPGISLEGMMLKLKLQYFGYLMQRVDSLERLWCWEGLGAGGEGDDRGWNGWMASLTQWTWVCVNSGSWWWTRRPGVLWFMGSQRVGHDWATELTELTSHLYVFFGEISVGVFCPFFDWVVYFPDIELYELLIYFWD